MQYHAAKYQEKAFNCPYCGVYAAQSWASWYYGGTMTPRGQHPLAASLCLNCAKYAYWYKERMFVPASGNAPSAHPDMPQGILGDYNEARSILSASPRGAAALLRLCVQKLCKELGEKGRNIDDDIASLVANRHLPVQIQQALDILRVIGNNAVHPGHLDLHDSPEVAEPLFGLINLIVEKMITEPRRIDEMYQTLPEQARANIDKRDAKAKPAQLPQQAISPTAE
jgi:hypothetical protein